MSEQYLTAIEAAKILNVSSAAVLNWARRGKIAFTRVGARYRFDRETIEKILRPTPENESLI